MKSQQAIITEQFYEFEKKYDLFNKKINGVYFWEVIRFKVLNNIYLEKGLFNKPHDKIPNSFLSELSRIPWFIRGLTINNPFFSKQKDLIIIGHQRRKKMRDGLWWDIYTDTFLNKLKISYLIMEEAHKKKHFLPSKSLNLKYYEVFEGILKILLFCSPKIKINYTDSKYLTELQSIIMLEFGIKKKPDLKVFQYLNKRKLLVPLLTYLFKKIKPKVIIVIVYYGRHHIIEAAKNLNIPVVELQHGMISKYHAAYNYPKLSRSSKFIPDYIFTFGNYWNNFIKLPISSKKIISCGYPFFEQQKALYSKVHKKKQIVFLSQGTIGKKLSLFASKVAKNLDKEYSIVFKYHPGEYSRDYNTILNQPNIKSIKNEKPLYEILAESEMQIGVNSTSIIEGIGMQVPKTAILDWSGHEYLKKLINHKNIRKISSVESVYEFIKLDIKNHYLFKTERFFTHNSIDNIIKNLKQILLKRQNCNYDNYY